MVKDEFISVVSPVYMGEKVVEELVRRIEQSVSKLTNNYEIILVEDNSPDKSWKEIEKVCLVNSNVKAIALSRNFGQHVAITAGLDSAAGDWVVVMDCDLQDKPEEIIPLYEKALEGYQIVLGRRFDRKDNWLKKLLSKAFYKALSYLTGNPIDPTIANFGIYHKNVIHAIKSMREPIRFFPSMVRWVGFNQTFIDVEHTERSVGNSSYNFKKRIRLALDIILAYSDKPLRLTVKIGFVIAVLSILGGVSTLVQYYTGMIKVVGFASLIVSIWFLSGLIIMILGITGLYIGKIFEAVKNRPLYFSKETLNL